MRLRLLFFPFTLHVVVTEVFLKTDFKYSFDAEKGGSISIPNCSLEKCNSDTWCNLFVEETGSCFYGTPKTIEPNSGDKSFGYLKDRNSKVCPTPFSLDTNAALSYFSDPCTCSSLWKCELDLMVDTYSDFTTIHKWQYSFVRKESVGTLKITKRFDNDAAGVELCAVEIAAPDKHGFGYIYLPKDATNVEIERYPEIPFEFICNGQYGERPDGTLFTEVNVEYLINSNE